MTDPPAFPVVIAEWNRNAREVVRVSLDSYRGNYTFDVRVWWFSGSELKPGKTGITLSLKHLPAMAQALIESEQRARDMGLVDDGAGPPTIEGRGQ